MLPFNHSEFIDDLTYLVKNNFIPMDRIDDAVGRILLVKFSMGLFENPMADLSLVNELGSQVSKLNHSLASRFQSFELAFYFSNFAHKAIEYC